MKTIAIILAIACGLYFIGAFVYVKIDSYEKPPTTPSLTECVEEVENRPGIDSLPTGLWWLSLNDGLNTMHTPGTGGEGFEVQENTIYPVISGGDLQSDTYFVGFEKYIRICENDTTCGWVLEKYGCLVKRETKVNP